MAVTEKKYQLGTAENKEFLQGVRDGLLSFGHQFPSPGGSSYYLGDDGTPWKDRNRETWITSRMTHVYSIGSMLGHEGSETLAANRIGTIKRKIRLTRMSLVSNISIFTLPYSCYAIISDNSPSSGIITERRTSPTKIERTITIVGSKIDTMWETESVDFSLYCSASFSITSSDAPA